MYVFLRNLRSNCLYYISVSHENVLYVKAEFFILCKSATWYLQYPTILNFEKFMLTKVVFI